MSEERRIKRYLKLRAKLGKLSKKSMGTTYADNKGFEYDYKWVAGLSSFFNVISGCIKNGFPVVVSRLRYNAWAFYPFFFIRKNLRSDNPIVILNHERIHIRQQKDIHVTISVPLIALCFFAEAFGWFNPIYLLCVVPFIPTLVYGIEMIRSWMVCVSYHKKMNTITFSEVRENTCFEREAISRSTNADYLFNRKFWAVLAYTGFKAFKNYGLK